MHYRSCKNSEKAFINTQSKFMNRILTFTLLSFFYKVSYTQGIIKDSLHPTFEWRLYLADAPYMTDAAKSEAIRDKDGTAPFSDKVKAHHFGKFYRNLSMTQTTEMTRNLHGSLYYGHNLLWNAVLKPTNTKKYILNRILANVTALSTDYLAIKLPYGYAFQHEEFHRSVMATRHIYSYDEVWKFGKGLDIAVTNVKDEDLIYLKKHFPSDQVRLAAAGVEGEYLYFQRMREDNFFKQTGYPMVGISIMGTLHAVNYVNLPFAARFNAITDSILAHDPHSVLARDFTGYDFSAWVYDLFTPNEPYQNRGAWPDGTGIKRPVKASELTPEMKNFLRQTGNMQYLNFVSPFMVGINRLRIQPGYYFNFALRSVPASFGYYAGGDFFLDFNKRQMMISVGINKSKKLTLPSVTLKSYDLIRGKNSRFNTNLLLSAWLQPKNQMFATGQAQPGFSISVEPIFSVSKRVSLMSDISYKSKGWVFGNPYLDNNFSARIGFSVKSL